MPAHAGHQMSDFEDVCLSVIAKELQSVKETQRLRHESLKEDISQIKEMQIAFRETSEGMVTEVTERVLKVCSQI